MRIKLTIIAAALFITLGACGKKTDLIVYDDSAPIPVLASVSHQVSGNEVQLQMTITGGSDSVVYQVDRAEVEPDCQCINNWLRYYESTPSTQREGLRHNIKLRSLDTTYAFRVRAADNLGRKSAWSKVFKVKAKNSE